MSVPGSSDTPGKKDLGGHASASSSAVVAPKPKRAYRYAVTGHGGTGTKAVGDSPFMLDWTYLGRNYTWQFYDLKTMERQGWIEGKYVDKGWLVDGGYKTDAEIKDAE